jgi:hypothetical protein
MVHPSAPYHRYDISPYYTPRWLDTVFGQRWHDTAFNYKGQRSVGKWHGLHNGILGINRRQSYLSLDQHP